MPWNLVCDPLISWSFYKKTIIRQLIVLLIYIFIYYYYIIALS